MATRRESSKIEDLVKQNMENRDITPAVTSKEDEKFNPPPKRQVQVRFDPGDYEKLQIIAHRKGTKAAALIREAVKGIIKDN